MGLVLDQNPLAGNDRESATRFVRWCTERIGLGYHPDTRFADYVEADGSRVFTSEPARQLDEMTEKASADIDPYEVGVAEF
jgi:hypothetical protein